MLGRLGLWRRSCRCLQRLAVAWGEVLAQGMAVWTRAFGRLLERVSCRANMGAALGPASYDSDDHPPLPPSGEGCACLADVLDEFQGFKPIIGLEPFS